MLVTAVIPVLNEAESLRRLHEELKAVGAREGIELELIFVDDGSRDGSWERIVELAAADPSVQGLRFRRNFGKAAALAAGFERARGQFVMTLDADLQDDPAEIPAFLARMKEGFDLVSGWKRERHDPWHKVFPSRVFNGLVGLFTGVKLHDHNCGMKCYRPEVIREIRLYGELHRFVPVLADARGFRVGELVIQHRARRHGRSKYGVGRFIKGLLDLVTVKFLTGFGQRPQHLLGSAGLLLFGLGTLILGWLTCEWAWSRMNSNPADDVHLHQRALFYYSLAAMLLGAQVASLGLLAEFVVARGARDDDTFSVAETTPSRRDAARADPIEGRDPPG